MKHLGLAVAILGAAPTLAFAQGDDTTGGGGAAPPPAMSGTTGEGPAIFQHGTMGLGFGIASIASPATPSGNINLTYFDDHQNAYDILFGFNYAHTPDTTMGMPPVTVKGGDIFGATVGIGYRMYKHHTAKIHTFLEPSISLSSVDLSNISDNLEIDIAGSLGVECMFTDWFSVSGTVGVGLEFADKFKEITLGTFHGGLAANMYWH